MVAIGRIGDTMTAEIVIKTNSVNRLTIAICVNDDSNNRNV